MANYYNDNDPFVAQWARNLIKAGLAPDGEVDERSIKEVKPDDLKGFVQCHFFCGILGWPLALRLAGWADDRPAWSGSCPCQSLSCAGKRKGHDDERHLWPAFHALIAVCRPATIFGEQVGSKDGREWLSAVRCDLEDIGYAVGAGRIPASAAGAPHERQRLFFVADNSGGQQRQENEGRNPRNGKMGHASADAVSAAATGRHQDGRGFGGNEEVETHRPVADSHSAGQENGQVEPRIRQAEISLNRCSFLEAWQGWNGGFGGFGRVDDGVSKGVAKSVVGGFGNAIVPSIAAEFIKAFLECRP